MEYWESKTDVGLFLNSPIPKINFLHRPHDDTIKNLKDCIQYMQQKTGHGAYDAWTSFIDWLLWGFGAKIQDEFPVKVDEDVSLYWYRTSNFGLMMKYPCDHMAWGSCEIAGMARSGSKSGYFPTPGHIVGMMTKMTMTDADKTKAVCDPCAGTGVMLLYASNYSLRLSGMDISQSLVKMANVNAYIYIPWMAFPSHGLIDWNTAEDYEAAIKAIELWRTETANAVPLITYRPRSDTLNDWI